MPFLVHVGALADLNEEEGVRVKVGSCAVAVFKRGNRVHAVGDSCPHMGASLAEGYLDGNQVICPWHGWVFDLDSGTSLFDANARVPIYRVVVEDGQVYFEMEGDPARVHAAPAPDEDS